MITRNWSTIVNLYKQSVNIISIHFIYDRMTQWIFCALNKWFSDNKLLFVFIENLSPNRPIFQEKVCNQALQPTRQRIISLLHANVRIITKSFTMPYSVFIEKKKINLCATPILLYLFISCFGKNIKISVSYTQQTLTLMEQVFKCLSVGHWKMLSHRFTKIRIKIDKTWKVNISDRTFHFYLIHFSLNCSIFQTLCRKLFYWKIWLLWGKIIHFYELYKLYKGLLNVIDQ